MRAGAVIAVVAFVFATPALAEEARGCDKFAWDVSSARALLKAPPQAGNTAGFDRDKAAAIALRLVPLAEAKLTKPPERAPKNPASFAGSASFAAGGTAVRTYRVGVSANAWIDVIQNGAYVRSAGFTGAHDCAGIRKSVEFAIGPGPFIVQVSGADSPEIGIVLTPAG